GIPWAPKRFARRRRGAGLRSGYESHMSDDDTKQCPVCAETIKAAAIKCRFCNTDLEAFTAAREAEIEQPLFFGHPAVVYNIGQWLLGLLTLGIGYLGSLFNSRPLASEQTTQP